MTVTLEIPPEMEVVLTAKAELFGLALPDYLFSLLETNVDDEYSLTVEEIASVQEGLAELHAGDKGMLLEDFRTEMTKKMERTKQQAMEVVA